MGGTGCRGRAGGTLCERCSSVWVFGSGPVQFDRVHDGEVVFVGGNGGLADKWECLCRPGFCIAVVVVVWSGACMGIDGSRAVCVWVGVCVCVVCGCEWCLVCVFGGSVGGLEHRLRLVGGGVVVDSVDLAGGVPL